ncbi:EAL domain-containing protein [Vibrio sp. AND4]|uniref:EAL domain-containing protein n=1 Tax=Vibrio sp. AND4 TaxID=314289 RepID=UPI00015F314B|nr:EAL domain-containing protein [Vibrio sp. AND4]EDP60662.1 Rtn protein [Vibrio sp. AND4]
MFANSKKNSKYLILLSFLPSFFALAFLYFNLGQSLSEQAKLKALSVVEEVDQILEFGEKANQKALMLLENPSNCEAQSLALRQLVATVPYVRTENLAKNKIVYCTSIWGESHYKYDPADYISGRLRLMRGSKVDAKHPLIVVRTELDENAAFSGIDSLYLRQLLEPQDKLRSVLSVGDKWLDSKELVLKVDPTEKLIGWHKVLSTNFPYSVFSGFDYSSMPSAFWNKDKQHIIVILVIQMLFALYLLWLSRRPSNLYLEIERAMENNEFVPYAQPILNSISREIQGIEILLRWQHPVQGVVGPDLFIPKAEQSGLIIPITHQLMRQAAQEISLWKDKLPKPFHVGINISPQHCSKQTLVSVCQEFIDIVDSEDVNLVLELTEREALNYCDLTDEIFTQLKNIGCKIAIDDFGTGHSSLVNLRKVDLDYLKIDQTFVRDIGVDTITGHLLQNMITLSHNLSLDVVAEGVETESQADYLRDKGVSYLQGFLFAKPMLLNDFLSSELGS